MLPINTLHGFKYAEERYLCTFAAGLHCMYRYSSQYLLEKYPVYLDYYSWRDYLIRDAAQ